MLKFDIDHIKSVTDKYEFTVDRASRGNFQVRFSPDQLREIRGLDRWRRIVSAAEELKAGGLNVEVQDSFQGQNGPVPYPCIWVNRESRQTRTSSTEMRKELDELKSSVHALVTALSGKMGVITTPTTELKDGPVEEPATESREEEEIPL